MHNVDQIKFDFLILNEILHYYFSKLAIMDHATYSIHIFINFRLDYIAYANLDGSNKKIIRNDNLAHIFAITVFEDYIYWTDWENSNVERAHKYTGHNRKQIGSTIHRPMDIQIYHKYRQMSYKKDQVGAKMWFAKSNEICCGICSVLRKFCVNTL